MNLSRESKILIGFIIIYIVVLGTISVLRHYNFQTQTWDMGAFEQTFWNTTQGRIMQNSLEEASNHLGVHMSPFLFLLTPGYMVFPSVYYLLIIQTIALALGAWPLYLLARRIVGNTRWALGIASAYLLYPSLHWVNLFDFHAVSFLVPLLLAAIYFAESKQWLWAWLFFLLAASTKEDAILVVAFTGLFVAARTIMQPKKTSSFTNRERKTGLAIFILMLIYFIVSVKILMPAFGGGLLRLDRYTNLGGSITEIIANVFTDPLLLFSTIFTVPKILYILFLFLPVAFALFFFWPSFILLIPGLAENLLTEFGYQFSNFYQYDAVLIAGIFIGAVFGIQKILARWPTKEKVLRWTLIGTVAIGFLLQSPLNPVGFPYFLFQKNSQWDAYRALISKVPEQVSVAAHTNLLPHLAHREQIFMLGREPYPPDILVIDGGDPFGFPDQATFQTYIDGYLSSGQYEAMVFEDRYAIIKKKLPN